MSLTTGLNSLMEEINRKFVSEQLRHHRQMEEAKQQVKAAEEKAEMYKLEAARLQQRTQILKKRVAVLQKELNEKDLSAKYMRGIINDQNGPTTSRKTEITKDTVEKCVGTDDWMTCLENELVSNPVLLLKFLEKAARLPLLENDFLPVAQNGHISPSTDRTKSDSNPSARRTSVRSELNTSTPKKSIGQTVRKLDAVNVDDYINAATTPTFLDNSIDQRTGDLMRKLTELELKIGEQSYGSVLPDSKFKLETNV